jgi:hypothetical protein
MAAARSMLVSWRWLIFVLAMTAVTAACDAAGAPAAPATSSDQPRPVTNPEPVRSGSTATPSPTPAR